MRHFKISILMIALFVLVLSSCKKNNSSSDSSDPSTSAILQQGTWRVSLYNDSGTDETDQFTGYAFTFNSNGTVAAVNNKSVVNGTWNTGIDNSQPKLYLNFGATVPFDKLNNDWHIIGQSSTEIRLEDVSGGSGGTDLLTFVKN